MKLVVLLVALCLFQVVVGILVTWTVTVFANLMLPIINHVLVCNVMCSGCSKPYLWWYVPGHTKYQTGPYWQDDDKVKGGFLFHFQDYFNFY
jgi:hypothetical protein